jgi:hypothetical protein
VYTLGVAEFDQFLAAAVEEEIRQLVRTTVHTEVYELRGGNDPRVVATLKELNKKFNRFGVHFTNITIRDVQFNGELKTILQNTTSFKSKINEQQKRQKHELEAIQFAADKEMETLVRNHERTIQELR